MAILRQKNGRPLAFERQAVIIYAAVNDYLVKVAVLRVPEYEEKLMAYLDAHAPAVLKSIEKARDMAPQTEEELKVKLAEFAETHPDLFR